MAEIFFYVGGGSGFGVGLLRYYQHYIAVIGFLVVGISELT